MTRMFKGRELDFCGLDLPQVVDIIRLNAPEVFIQEDQLDMGLKLDDGSLAHFVFETSQPTIDQQILYGRYDLALFSEYDCRIRRIVIYGSHVKTIPEPIDTGSVRLNETSILLREGYDGDAIFQRIREKISIGKELHCHDEMNIVLLPLMQSESTPTERAREVIDFLMEGLDEENRLYLVGLLMAVNYRSICRDYKKMIVEMFKGHSIFQDFCRGLNVE